MEGSERESTQDWLLPEHARPPLIGELERRVEEALATARASEAAVMTVGAAAIRAAELAERASLAAASAQEMVSSADGGRPAAAEADGGDEGLSDFSERADRLVERLRQLQRVPLPSPASGGAGRPQPAR